MEGAPQGGQLSLLGNGEARGVALQLGLEGYMDILQVGKSLGPRVQQEQRHGWGKRVRIHHLQKMILLFECKFYSMKSQHGRLEGHLECFASVLRVMGTVKVSGEDPAWLNQGGSCSGGGHRQKKGLAEQTATQKGRTGTWEHSGEHMNGLQT